MTLQFVQCKQDIQCMHKSARIHNNRAWLTDNVTVQCMRMNVHCLFIVIATAAGQYLVHGVIFMEFRGNAVLHIAARSQTISGLPCCML